MKKIVTLILILNSIISLSQSEDQIRILSHLNDIRKRPFAYKLVPGYGANFTPLVFNDTLNKVAQMQADSMLAVKRLSHYPTGKGFTYYLKEEGFDMSGDVNLFEGCGGGNEDNVFFDLFQNTPEGALHHLMSIGKEREDVTVHQSYLMAKRFKIAGVGYATDGNYSYICVILSK